MFERVVKEYKSIDLDEMRFEGFLEKRAAEIKECVENVAKGKGWKDKKECPVCASRERQTIMSRYGFNVMKCFECGVGYMEKFPVDTGDVYSDVAYLPIAQSDYLDHVDYRQQRFAQERLDIIWQYMKKPAEQVRLLDVGCGTGWFLDSAKKSGFQTAGQEFGKDLAAFTAKRLGICVWSEPLTKIPVNEKFDVITLFDVIEHVPNPREVIQSIADHLNPGGISLLFTPNLDAFAFAKLKERSSLIMPVEHLFYFTIPSLKRLVDEAGLTVLKAETKGMDIPDIFSHYRDDLKNQAVADFLREHCSQLQAMIDASGCANHLRFIVTDRKFRLTNTSK